MDRRGAANTAARDTTHVATQHDTTSKHNTTHVDTPLRPWSCWSPGRCHRRIRSRSCGRGGTSFPRGAPWQRQQQRRPLIVLCCGRRCWESSCAFIATHAHGRRDTDADVGSPPKPQGQETKQKVGEERKEWSVGSDEGMEKENEMRTSRRGAPWRATVPPLPRDVT